MSTVLWKFQILLTLKTLQILNSPMSIPVSLAQFLGRLDTWLNFGGPGNAQDRQIWISRKFEKSTYLS